MHKVMWGKTEEVEQGEDYSPKDENIECERVNSGEQDVRGVSN